MPLLLFAKTMRVWDLVLATEAASDFFAQLQGAPRLLRVGSFKEHLQCTQLAYDLSLSQLLGASERYLFLLFTWAVKETRSTKRSFLERRDDLWPAASLTPVANLECRRPYMRFADPYLLAIMLRGVRFSRVPLSMDSQFCHIYPEYSSAIMIQKTIIKQPPIALLCGRGRDGYPAKEQDHQYDGYHGRDYERYQEPKDSQRDDSYQRDYQQADSRSLVWKDIESCYN
jgi:hypothetical protein